MEFELKNIKNSASTTNTIGTHNTLNKEDKNRYIQSFISQLFNRLNPEKQLQENNVDVDIEIVYVIDRFEGNYAVCENIETGEMENINIYEMPEDIGEGEVVRFKNNEYIKDVDLKEEIEERIKNKANSLFED